MTGNDIEPTELGGYPKAVQNLQDLVHGKTKEGK